RPRGRQGDRRLLRGVRGRRARFLRAKGRARRRQQQDRGRGCERGKVGRMSHAPPAKGRPMTLSKLAEKKALGEPIVMITAYDYPSAQVAEEPGAAAALAGDPAAMTVLGYPSTVPVSLDEMLMLAAAVRRGLSTPFLVGDMPFGSYEVSNEQAITTAQRFI